MSLGVRRLRRLFFKHLVLAWHSVDSNALVLEYFLKLTFYHVLILDLSEGWDPVRMVIRAVLGIAILLEKDVKFRLDGGADLVEGMDDSVTIEVGYLLNFLKWFLMLRFLTSDIIVVAVFLPIDVFLQVGVAWFVRKVLLPWFYHFDNPCLFPGSAYAAGWWNFFLLLDIHAFAGLSRHFLPVVVLWNDFWGEGDVFQARDEANPKRLEVDGNLFLYLLLLDELVLKSYCFDLLLLSFLHYHGRDLKLSWLFGFLVYLAEDSRNCHFGCLEMQRLELDYFFGRSPAVILTVVFESADFVDYCLFGY